MQMNQLFVYMTVLVGLMFALYGCEAHGQPPRRMSRTQWNSRPVAVWMAPEQRTRAIESEQQLLEAKQTLSREYELQRELTRLEGKLARQQLGNTQSYQQQQMYGSGQYYGGGYGYYLPNGGRQGYNYYGSSYYGGHNWSNPVYGYGYAGQGYRY
jgi:hypothetical protein